MSKHYHLMAETPKANLLAKMRWLENTYILRHKICWLTPMDRPAAASMRCACFSGGTSCGDPFGNHSRFQVVIRTLTGSGDWPKAEPTTKNVSRASRTRFTRLHPYSLSVREKDFSTGNRWWFLTISVWRGQWTVEDHRWQSQLGDLRRWKSF